jgi:hypothetical protein
MATPLQLVIDCADAVAQARFWATAMHYELEDPPDGQPSWFAYYRSVGVPEEELVGPDEPDRIVDPDGVGPRIWFQEVPEPKTVKNRLHLDLGVSGKRDVPREVRKEQVDTEVARLLAAGATVAWTHDDPGVDQYAVTMYDPEGNEFCVHRPGVSQWGAEVGHADIGS